MIRRPPRSTQSRSSAASDVYKRQDMEGASIGRILLLGLCLWSCALASGESVDTSQSDTLMSSSGDGPVDPATMPLVSAVGKGDNPGRRRRADQRRRTHLPEKTPAELRRMKAAREAKLEIQIKKARDEKMREIETAAALEHEKQQLKISTARQGLTNKIEVVKKQKHNLKVNLKRVLQKNLKLVKVKAAEAEALNQEKLTEKRSAMLRISLEEAEKNVNEALKFVHEVNKGHGDDAYRKSFLFAENQKAGLGGPGGFASLQGVQLTIPWMVSLNIALSNAKRKTTYANMLKVQRLLDTANEHVHTLEVKYKSDKEHRASVTEALQKAAVRQERLTKQANKKELVKKKEGELMEKENNRKSQLSKLEARTQSLQKQAKELEEKSYKSLEKKDEPTPAKDGEEGQVEQGPTREMLLGAAKSQAAESLIHDAHRSHAKAEQYKSKEGKLKQTVQMAESKLQAFEGHSPQ
eukprot:TRINITY_DN26197_c0_g1_i1.p1 TRINITY_DN26197_c0_g1~~TRINITY_DN26197_c0_g1_i1.p1  ORF type:complete len:467 (+),score=202.55 TRINITY_DN26197_c0_g1_i1:141-1541(+)